VVWGAILRYSGQSGVVYAGHGPSYRDLFPSPPTPEDALSCSIGGVLPTVCAVIGSIMCTEAIKLITGIGEPLIGRVTTYDALSGRFREISYRAIPDAAPVTELIDYELFCGRGPAEPVQAASVQAVSTSALELSQWLIDGRELQLIDVREPFEARIAKITGSELIPLGTIEGSLDRIRRDVPVVLYCHYDSRSRHAAGILRQNGITDVLWLEGGIDAYSATADHTLARY
jgi:adenylyltransferase/sulfurtransferase